MIVPYVIENDQNGERSYEIYSKLLMDRIVFIQGEFTEEVANVVVAQLLYLHSSDPEKDIYMYINSPGGRVDAMFAIYDTMQYISPDINTVGIGTVASAGSFILAAGTKGKRSALPNTSIMVHELSSGTSGKAGDIFNDLENIKKLYEKLSRYYSQFTGQTVAKIKKDLQRDFFMTPKEALKYGLIDEVIGE